MAQTGRTECFTGIVACIKDVGFVGIVAASQLELIDGRLWKDKHVFLVWLVWLL